jgi:hypothetical protein
VESDVVAILGCLGGHLGPCWAVLGPSWAMLGCLRAILGPSWGHLGPYWGHIGSNCGHLGVILSHPGVMGALLWLFWAIFGPTWPSGGTILVELEDVPCVLEGPGGQLGHLGVPSWPIWRTSHAFWGSGRFLRDVSHGLGGSCGPKNKATRALRGSGSGFGGPWGMGETRQENIRLMICGIVDKCTRGCTGLIREDCNLSPTAWWPLTRRGRTCCILRCDNRCKFVPLHLHV